MTNNLRIISTALMRRKLICQGCGRELAHTRQAQAGHSSVLLELADSDGRWHVQPGLWPSHTGAMRHAAGLLGAAHASCSGRLCAACQQLRAMPGERYCDGCATAADRAAWAGQVNA